MEVKSSLKNSGAWNLLMIILPRAACAKHCDTGMRICMPISIYIYIDTKHNKARHPSCPYFKTIIMDGVFKLMARINYNVCDFLAIYMAKSQVFHQIFCFCTPCHIGLVQYEKTSLSASNIL